ncbi:YciI family protein [Burkholderia multivorans]|uniref:YciI family protein n=1 Tax=Burkholderia multivorans TaxID=87883 RepID=UPI0009BDDAC8|nr:YciI family protein [Burkholderia multivorans]MCA8456824.1 YciI family protein [Burkholderia multivorans]
MLFAITLLDKPERGHLRTERRPQHLDYLGRVADRIAFAGPLTSDDGQKMIGSLLVIDFPSRSAAQAWLADEPYTRAGLYASTAVYPFANRWRQRTGFPDPA